MHRLVLTLLAASLCPAAHAQVAEVYVTFSPIHASNISTGVVSTATGYQTQTASFTTSGVGGGVTLNFLNLRVVKLGFDLRGSTRPGITGADTALAGLKLAFKPPLLRLKPYVQASGGYLATRTQNVTTGLTGSATFSNQYAVYEILGGVDLPFAPFLDLRLFELGGGSGIGFDNYKPTFYTINTGLVVHF